MSLDELNLDSSEVWWNSAETPSEKNEKQKEPSKRAQIQLQKTQKDEQKAKWDNVALFHILTRFIQNPLYEDLIPSVITLLEAAYPSRYIISIIALVYPQAAQYILLHTGKSEAIEKYKNLHRYADRTIFHNDTMHESIREWVSLWMSTTQEFLIARDSSIILHQKCITLLSGEKRSVIKNAIMVFFTYFFDMRNVSIEANKAETYAVFILWEYEKSVNTYLSLSDTDLRFQSSIDANSLFGLV